MVERLTDGAALQPEGGEERVVFISFCWFSDRFLQDGLGIEEQLLDGNKDVLVQT
ncbi:MAG: hypothetical protein QOG30_328, partial [Acidimicrobiaceae bacterium]